MGLLVVAGNCESLRLLYTVNSVRKKDVRPLRIPLSSHYLRFE